MALLQTRGLLWKEGLIKAPLKLSANLVKQSITLPRETAQINQFWKLEIGAILSKSHLTH